MPALMQARVLAFAAILFLAPLAVHGGEGTRFAEPGMIAPDFTVLDVEGHPFRLSEEVSGKPVLLLFWSVFCDPCRAEMAILQKAHDRYVGRGLSVVAVAVDGGPLRSTIRGYARQEGYAFRILVDELNAAETWNVADPFGVAATPTLLLLEKGGKVLLRKGGRIREDELEKAVSSLLKK